METQQAKESFSDILSGNIPVLVDFTAAWCGPCRMMKPVLEELHKKMGNSVRILKVDIDKNPDTAMAYHVSSVPTLILFKNGQTLWRQSGLIMAPQLEKIIRQQAKL